jgi:hypothetical protein
MERAGDESARARVWTNALNKQASFAPAGGARATRASHHNNHSQQHPRGARVGAAGHSWVDVLPVADPAASASASASASAAGTASAFAASSNAVEDVGRSERPLVVMPAAGPLTSLHGIGRPRSSSVDEPASVVPAQWRSASAFGAVESHAQLGNESEDSSFVLRQMSQPPTRSARWRDRGVPHITPLGRGEVRTARGGGGGAGAGGRGGSVRYPVTGRANTSNYAFGGVRMQGTSSIGSGGPGLARDTPAGARAFSSGAPGSSAKSGRSERGMGKPGMGGPGGGGRKAKPKKPVAIPVQGTTTLPMAVTPHGFGPETESSEPLSGLTRSDTLFSRARRALSNPINAPQDAYIDLDPSRGPHNDDRLTVDVERRAASRGRGAWPASYEMRMKEMESELAAALSESERMSNTIRELQEENAQTKGAVPVLEDVLMKARHHFDIKERALKRTIARLASDLSAAVQEKNEALRLLSQYTAHGATFREQTPPALRFHTSSRSEIRDSNVWSRSAHSGRTREALFRDTTAGRRLEELEELSGPLSYPR